MQNSQPIPVVIFCGGKGTRLKEETEFKPKPMVTVGGRPILWHIMKAYAHFGYHRFILCLGYKGYAIKEYFLQHRLFSADFHLDTKTHTTTIYESRPDGEFEITFAETGEDTLTGERLMRVSRYLDTDQFMVTYGDGVTDLNVQTLHAYHNAMEQKHGMVGTITGVHPRSKYGLINVDENNVITDFRQKPVLHDYTNGGFMVFNKKFLPYLKEDQMVEDAVINAIQDRKMSVYHHDGFWHCMDTYDDMSRLNALWNESAPWKVWA